MSEPSSSIMKRPCASNQDSTTNLQHDDYTVAWITALPLEMTAAEAMLDTIHQPLSQHPQDSNCYTLGNINGHNVVMACLPKGQYGTNNAATVASHLTRSFLNIQHRLMVGIGGGAPGSADIRLGDVVVSTEVLQYDLGKAMPDDQFQRIAYPIRPPQSLMTAVSKLQASHSRGANHFTAIIMNSTAKLPHYVHPNLQDRLFQSDYNHPETSKSCDDCDQTKLSSRDARRSTDPVIHFGRIASGNQVIKDAQTRDKLSKELSCVCFEMEAAGMMDSSPHLTIRGICDYSDSHKNKKWQEYAALAAAAYAKDLLLAMPPQLPTPSKRRKAQEPEIPDTEARECLKALFVTDPAQDREDILAAKGQICQGTCGWVLTTEEFKTWEQNPPHLLWISAPPGVGKTFLSIYLSEHFEALSEERHDIRAIYFFCDNKIDTRNTAINILRGLIHQMIKRERYLTKVIMPVWDQRSSQLFENQSFGALWKVFSEMIQNSNFRTIYCVIDALDECQHDSLSQLLIKLEQLSDSDNTSPKKLKLVCLSRRFPVTIPESLDLFTKIKLDMMSASKEDVGRFIAERVYTLVRKKKFNEKIKARIQEDFQRKSEGTFLWVSFMAQDLEQKSLREIEPALRALPAGLDAVYDRILSQISLSERDTINTLLSWILVATRPLRIPELCAVADVRATELLSREEVCRELIRSCGHLLQISEGVSSMIFFEEQVGTDEEMSWVGAFDEEERSTGEDFWSLSVTFLHQSAKDYIVKHKGTLLREEDGTSVRRLHGFVANHLIRYFRKISRHPDFVDNQFYKMTVDLPLTLYATRNWILHLEEAHDVKQVVLQNKRFFGEGSASRDAYEDIMESIEWEFQEQLGPAGPTDSEIFTGSESPAESESCATPLLHLACYRNLQRLVRWCLTDEQLEYINVPWGIERRTPLHFAIIQQNEEIVHMLLNANADILAEASTRQNAFVCAMYHQDIEILRRMAEKNDCKRWITQEALNPKTTLLWEACFARNEEACRLLIEKFSFDVNSKVPQWGRAVIYDLIEWNNVELALTFFVMWNAHVNSWKALEVIIYHDQNRFHMWQRLLLIDINAKHEKGYNACVMALQAPSSRVTKLSTFLCWGCDSNQPDNEGRTPFHYCAIERGLLRSPQEFEGALALLLFRGAHVNGVCHKGRTILHYLTNSFSQPLQHYRPLPSSDARQLVVYLLDRGVDRHCEDNEGLSALQTLGTCLFPSREQMGYDEWSEYVKAAKEMIFVLQEYSTVPDPPWYDANPW